MPLSLARSFIKNLKARRNDICSPFSKISNLKAFKKTGQLWHVRLAYMTINLATQTEVLKGIKQG